jgi:dTDP-4-amino-4,6-dideoxygalactose transaminase
MSQKPTPPAVTGDQKPVRTKDRFLVFGAPDIGDAEINEVNASMRARWLGTGPKVARFEDEFLKYQGGKHAAAVNSCTAALHLAMVAAGLKPGDEVITTPMTFCATANAVIHASGTPVLADVDPATMNIDPRSIESRITEQTKALLVVHFAGKPCDMDAINAIVKRHDLFLIEDCAHAIEATYRGQHVGNFGRFGCFSFYATKNLTTGEGGMVVSRDKADSDQIKILALHGMSQDAWRRFSDAGYKHYSVVACGFKYNMMDLQAAIGLHQLAKIETAWLKRQQIWRQYDEQLKSTGLGLPPAMAAGEKHSLHLYTVMVDPQKCGLDRDTFLTGMTAQGIGMGVHYRSLAEHPYYQERFGWRPEQWPHALRIGQQTVSLPLSPGMNDGDVADVLTAVRRVLRR